MPSTDANALFRTVMHSRGFAAVEDLPVEIALELALRFAIWVPTATYAVTPWLAPYAIRKIRLRVEPHAPGEVRDLWGTPTNEGYFTDDNSLIKPTVLRRPLAQAALGPYGTSPVSKGLVCCHVWAGTTTDPLLFSFIPNLVWLPADLARLSDAHSTAPPHPLHDVLKEVSQQRYRSVVSSADPRRVESAWNLLPSPRRADRRVEGDSGNEVAAPSPIIALIAKRIDRLVTFLDGTLSDGPMPKRFSKRFHAGVGPRIDMSVSPIQHFVPKGVRQALAQEMRGCVGRQ